MSSKDNAKGRDEQAVELDIFSEDFEGVAGGDGGGDNNGVTCSQCGGSKLITQKFDFIYGPALRCFCCGCGYQWVQNA